MKSKILALALFLLPMQTFAETTYGSITRLESNVGSRTSIQLQSNFPSMFMGTFSKTFTHQNTVSSFSRNFVFSGNMNYNIVSTFNTNTTIFTNNPGFNW